MAITPVTLVKTVTTAGTQIQVTTDTDIRPSSVVFTAKHSNTGRIYIGVSDVSSDDYIAVLDAGQSFSLASDGNKGGAGRIAGYGIQLSDLWVDSSVNGEICMVSYMFPVE